MIRLGPGGALKVDENSEAAARFHWRAQETGGAQSEEEGPPCIGPVQGSFQVRLSITIWELEEPEMLMISMVYSPTMLRSWTERVRTVLS